MYKVRRPCNQCMTMWANWWGGGGLINSASHNRDNVMCYGVPALPVHQIDTSLKLSTRRHCKFQLTSPSISGDPNVPRKLLFCI